MHCVIFYLIGCSTQEKTPCTKGVNKPPHPPPPKIKGYNGKFSAAKAEKSQMTNPDKSHLFSPKERLRKY